MHLRTFDGSIEIRSSDSNQVLIEIEKRGPTREAVEALLVESSQDGSRVTLEVKQPRKEAFNGFGFHMSASARLVVTVPRRSDIVARTGDGAIRLDGVNGRLELRTGDGAIRVAGVTGELLLNTGDGAITVDGAEGSFARDRRRGGQRRGETVVGQDAHRRRLDRLPGRSGARMNDDWDISTGDGSVSPYLPSSFSAELDAHTGDGGIRNELRVEDLEKSGERDRDKQTLRARLGDGGRRLRIQTGDGAISREEPAEVSGTLPLRPRSIPRRIGRSCRQESVAALSALAAAAAVHAIDRLHARERQLERHPSSAPRLITSALCSEASGVSIEICHATPATAPAPSFRRSEVSHPETDCRRAVRASPATGGGGP